MIDVVAVPDRLEHAVGEAQHHDVLHRLLAEVVIDPVNLIPGEEAQQVRIQCAGRFEIEAERLFNDQPAPAAVVFIGETGLAKLARHRSEQVGWRRQIKQAIVLRPAAAAELGEFALKLVVGRRIRQIARHVSAIAKQRVGGFCIHAIGGKFVERRPHAVPKFVAGPWRAGDADERETLGQQLPDREIIKRGQQQPLGEIAGRTEDDEGARIGGARRPSGGDRNARRGDVHDQGPFASI